MTFLCPAGWDELVAKARRHHRGQHLCHWDGLGSHEQKSAIGLVASATASRMAGSSLVRWEVSGTMPGLPGLTPHAYIPIDSNTGHVQVETEADKEYRVLMSPHWQTASVTCK